MADTPPSQPTDAHAGAHAGGLPMPLRRGQRRAVARIVDIAERIQGDGHAVARVQYYAATGSGKTIISRVVADAVRARTVAFGAPRIDLLGQAFQEYHRATSRRIEPIVICSAPDIREARGFPPDTPVTTSAEVVRDHLLRPVPDGVVRVVFFTYQSARRLVRALTGLSPVDLLVLDEAHRVVRPDSAFSLVWDAAAIPARLRLAQTATPRAEMALTGVYGVVADRYSVGEGIADRVLCDYRVHVLGVNDASTATLLRTERDRRSVAVANALLTAIEQGHMSRVLTFHRRRDDAHTFARIARRIAAARGIRVPTLLAQSGLDSPVARANALGQLEVAGGIIASPRIYLEGINVRAVDTVVFVDPKSSVIDISQAVGRAMRVNPADPAKIAQIVIPVAVGEHEGATTLLESSEFHRVWDVLRVLAAEDPRLGDAFEQLRPHAARMTLAAADLTGSADDRSIQSLSLEAAPASGPVLTLVPRSAPPAGTPAPDVPWGAHARSGAGIPHDATGDGVGDAVTTPFFESHLAVTGDLWSLASAVRLRAVDGVGDQRAHDIALLAAFAERTGTTRVAPTFTLPNGYPLGARVARLRSDYHTGRLPSEFVATLERLGPWVAESGARSAVATLWPYLLTFEAEHGHVAVPTDFVAEARDTDVGDAEALARRVDLGARVEAVRAAGRARRLTPDEVRQCETLAGWTWNLAEPTLYLRAVPLLRAFVSAYGTARVPAPEDWPGSRSSGDVIELVAALRHAYAQGRLPLGDERALEREFALPWTPPSVRGALRRKFAGAAQWSARQEFAAAWGATPQRPRRRRR